VPALHFFLVYRRDRQCLYIHGARGSCYIFNNTLSFFYFSSMLVILEVGAKLFSISTDYDGKWSPSVG
jgi:hypothetical protein